MQAVGRRYVQYINRSYKRTGSLWEGRYKSSLIQAETYLLTCMRYIESVTTMVEQAEADAERRHREPERVALLRVPGGADPEPGPPAREDVERRCSLHP